MLAAIAYMGWSFVGFEAAAAIAEEVEEPERNVPKALILSLLAVGVVVMYSGAALILAIPDLSAAVSGEVADPVGGTLIAHFGSAIARPMLVMFVIGFPRASSRSRPRCPASSGRPPVTGCSPGRGCSAGSPGPSGCR